MTVSVAPAAYIVVLEGSAWDVCCSDTAVLVGPVVAEQPAGCRRGDSACRHSLAAAAELAKDKAGEVRGSSYGGHGQGAVPIVNSAVRGGVEAAVRVHGAGSRSVLAARQRV